jgi:hypothetical protein
LVAEATVLLALVEVGAAEELLDLTVVEAVVVLTAAMLVEDALTLLVAGASQPKPHPMERKHVSHVYNYIAWADKRKSRLTEETEERVGGRDRGSVGDGDQHGGNGGKSSNTHFEGWRVEE